MNRTKRPLPLGKRVATYRSLRPAPLAIGAWLGLSLGVVLQLASSLLGPESVGGVALLVVPTLAWITWIQQIPRRVDLYQNGLDYRVGRRHDYVLWNQIHEIYQTPLHSLHRPNRLDGTPDSWVYRLVHRDGRSLRLYRLESIRSLGQRVQDHVLRRHLPVALDAFHAGYSIRFGRHLAVSLEGLRFHRKMLAWHEVAEITIDETTEFQVIERRQPRWRKRLAIRHVPNLFLLDQILRASQQASAPDPLDVAPQRGGVFDESPDLTPQLPGPEPRDEPDDSGESTYRPRQPK